MRSCLQRCSPRNSTSRQFYNSTTSAPWQRGPSRSSRPLPQQTARARAPLPPLSSSPRSALSSSSTSSSSSPSSSSSSPPRVYLQVTPLEGFSFFKRGPAQLSPHAVVVLEIFSNDGGIEQQRPQQQQRQVFAFDFLPREPKQLSSALDLFLGKPVEATGRERRLARVPRRRCVLVGRDGGGGAGEEEEEEEEEEEAPAAAAKRNASLLAAARARLRAWEATPLVWRRFDCTHAAVELASELAGCSEDAARRALERACSSSS